MVWGRSTSNAETNNLPKIIQPGQGKVEPHVNQATPQPRYIPISACKGLFSNLRGVLAPTGSSRVTLSQHLSLPGLANHHIHFHQCSCSLSATPSLGLQASHNEGLALSPAVSSMPWKL